MRQRFKEWWRKSGSKQSETGKVWELLPLTPEFIEKEHGGYLGALQEALTDPKIRNIALSGRYGVGKSSILQELARSRKGKVVELSLSTLAPLAEEGLDDSVPKQARTTTNRIQQEIVKQLLYREKPSKMPGSRFRRIERFSLLREFAFAGLAGIALTVIGLLTGWTSQIKVALLPKTDLGLWSHGIVLVLGIVATGIVRWAIYGRVQIRQLSAGPATVTLDDQSVSYFDQYLDEIVYFFEVSKHTIVIFEDIDRFDDARIFETLLALNTLLNAQRRDSAPIRFIYAIKDSIFDQSTLSADEKRKLETGIKEIKDPAQAEILRANRTKFFDLVIPVVPFITHRSAKNLVWEVLEGVDSEVKPALTDLAARYIPDMRLIKNVRNEFIVFRDRIFSGAGEDLELCKTELFAMVLYKCTHLADFEAISIGRSKIDSLYQAERDLVSVNIATIQKEIRQRRDKLTTIENTSTESQRLGKRLLKHIEHTIHSWSQRVGNGQCWFKGKSISDDDLLERRFWAEFTEAPGDPVLEWKLNNTPRVLFQFPRSMLGEVLNNPMDPDSWDEKSEELLKTEIEEREEKLQILRRAHMGDLIDRPEFTTTTFGGEQKSFDTIARNIFSGDSMAYELIRHGYINRNFTLYTATFHGNRVSAAAQNFIMLHAERDLMDEHFVLEGPDVEGVILQCGEESLAEPSLYNVAILDHLLKQERDTADIMIRSLVRFGERQKRFVQAYLNSGTESASFIGRFTKVAPDVLNNLVEDTELSQSERLELVSCALGSLEKNLEYSTNNAVRTYLSDHYADLPMLTSESIKTDSAADIAKVFSNARIQVLALGPLNPLIQQALIESDCYALTRENIAIALENDTRLTLDLAQKKSKSVYQRLLQDLPGYLSAIDGCSPTVESESSFISVIEDVLASDSDRLGEVIALASTDCVVENLKEVSPDAWPQLAEYQRFPATFTNVNEYIGGVGEIDGYLAGLLDSAGAIIDHESFDEEDKQALAVKILATQDTLLSAFSRAKLVASLQLRSYVNVELIEAERGGLFALLLKEDVIADSAENYAYLYKTDWLTREQFIEESENFPRYMTPDLIGDELAMILRSRRVAGAVKSAIVDDAVEYAVKCDSRGLAELARFAVQYNQNLTPEVVEIMAVNEVSPQHVVRLLQPNLSTIPYDQLARILSFLGDNYSALTSAGRDKPKFPDTEENLALLNKLEEHGHVVSQVKPARGGKLKVWKRYGSRLD